MAKLRWALMILAALTLSGCGYNEFQTKDEQVKAAWGEVLNQYQRRADLIPNLVATVQGYAAQERDVLIGVTEARAKATAVNVSANDLSDPAKMQQFQQAQAQLSGALGRLLVVAEAYPQLKSDANFRELQAQLEGTENRISVERGNFNNAVQNYNVAVRSFPTNLIAGMLGFPPRPFFTAQAGAEKPPPVQFNFGPAPTPAGNLNQGAVPTPATAASP